MYHVICQHASRNNSIHNQFEIMRYTNHGCQKALLKVKTIPKEHGRSLTGCIKESIPRNCWILRIDTRIVYKSYTWIKLPEHPSLLPVWCTTLVPWCGVSTPWRPSIWGAIEAVQLSKSSDPGGRGPRWWGQQLVTSPCATSPVTRESIRESGSLTVVANESGDLINPQWLPTSWPTT